jgi:uncharacterized protein involved in exopolysaccharide biosynthesis
MTTKRNLAILLVFAAFAFIGATVALSTVGVFESVDLPTVYAQGNVTGNVTGGNVTGNMSGGMTP